MRNVDFIIVGQGLAGTCLAWELLALGASVVVIDREAAVTSSRIAAGLITPVTGLRLVKTWRWEALRAAAWDFYRRIENDLGCSLLRETSMVKVFASAQGQDYFQKRMRDLQYAGLISETKELPVGVSAPFGSCELWQGGQLYVAEFLQRSRERFVHEGCYLAGDLAWPEDLRGEGEVELPRWGLRASKLIFCQGINARSNPWFSPVEFNPARGEMLVVRIPNWTEDRIVHGSVWIAPGPPPFYRVGATYDWSDLDAGPTPAGRQSLIESLDRLLHVPYEIVDHQSAVRPILQHVHPVVGMHPRDSRLGYFNGLGSKGSLQAPFIARHFASHLMMQTPLDPEVDLQVRTSWRPVPA